MRLVTPTGLATMEIFDLTQDDSMDEPEVSEDDVRTMRSSTTARAKRKVSHEALRRWKKQEIMT